MLAAPTAVCAAGRYYPTDERVVYYLACFLYTSSEYGAVAFPPVKTNGMEDFHNFRRNIEERVRPLYPQYRAFACVADNTAEAAIQSRNEGYRLTYDEVAWPKGMPEDARPMKDQGYLPRDKAPKPPEPEKAGAPAPKPPPKPTSPPEPRPAPPPAALIIKEDTSAKDFRKAFDEQVAKDLAAQDRKRAEAAAKGAQADAEMQRRIKQVMDERRRRGPAQ